MPSSGTKTAALRANDGSRVHPMAHRLRIHRARSSGAKEF
jgi:hypothetical protein